MNNIEHTVSFSGSEIIYLAAVCFQQSIKSLDMAERKVNNMDIVAHTCAVMGRIIVPADIEIRELAYRHLRNIRHKVSGNTVGILAYTPALVRTDGIEVAKNGNSPILVRNTEILKNILNKIFGGAVWIGGAARGHILFERRRILAAVNGCRGAENNLFAAVLTHRLAE